jgi:iron-sulfur cluster repair protein YtfE (RIC family)
MSETSNWLIHDHRRYEMALEACEFAAGAEEWKEAVRRFEAFVEDLRLHMRLEDEVLYPFLREQLGDSEGELERLSEEHGEIARLLQDLATVIKNKDFDHFEESLRPLYQAMTEHHEHEEQVLSRLGEGHALLARRDEVVHRLEALASPQAGSRES